MTVKLVLASKETINGYRYALLICSLASFVITNFVTSSKATENLSHRTTWRNADQSLTELLDSGWQVISQSSNRAYYGGVGTGKIDETTFTYTLRKGSKYITCIIYEPEVKGATFSRCRYIN
jgi:hypothetical protein